MLRLHTRGWHTLSDLGAAVCGRVSIPSCVIVSFRHQSFCGGGWSGLPAPPSSLSFFFRPPPGLLVPDGVCVGAKPWGSVVFGKALTASGHIVSTWNVVVGARSRSPRVYGLARGSRSGILRLATLSSASAMSLLMIHAAMTRRLILYSYIHF
jgi:hypothetical protein